MRILVVEDHALVREGLMLALQSLETPDDPVEVMGACDAEAASQYLDVNSNLDLLVLDLMLPGISGIALLGVVRKRCPHIPVVILSALDDVETVTRVMRGGAAGFVSKASPTAVLLEALRAVLGGEFWVPPAYRDTDVMAKRTGSLAERYELTKTQACVLDLLAEGKSNREIAEIMAVVEGTVKTHVSAVFKAMGVTKRSQVMLRVQRGKIFKPIAAPGKRPGTPPVAVNTSAGTSPPLPPLTDLP